MWTRGPQNLQGTVGETETEITLDQNTGLYFFYYFGQRISIVTQRGNAASIAIW